MTPTDVLPRPRVAAQPSTGVIRTMYAYLAVFAYLLYGMGYVTPYLRDDLGLSDLTVGLHATALAFGSLAAGLSVDWMTRQIGLRRLLLLAVWTCAAAVLLVVA